MNGSARQLRCRYLVAGPGDQAGTVVARLDRLARHEVPAAFASALDQALGDDQAVYVVRRVRASLVWNLADGEAGLSHAWGERMARSVLRMLADADAHRADLVRFDDEAEYAGHFLADLMAGRAWDRWFYRPFGPLRALGTAGAARAVLLEHGDLAAAVLTVVSRLGGLERLLVTVDDGVTLERLWGGDRSGGRRSMDTPPERAAEAARPVFLAALRLVDRLGLWTAAPRPGDDLFWQAYTATAPLPPSWRDVGELTAAFLAVLRLLACRGHLRTPAGGLRPAELQSALDELDWLDTTSVRAAIERMLEPAESDGSGSPLPVLTGGHPPTLRQRQLVADLADLLRPENLTLDAGRPESARNALLLHTALVGAAPRWADDELAKRMVERLLAAVGQLAGVRARAEVTSRLRHGDARGALDLLSAAERPAAAGAYQFLTAFPELVAAVAALATGTSQVTIPDAAVPTECAGVFLLLRTAADARLAALTGRAGYPAPGVVLLSLALRWAGRVAAQDGRLDPGLAFLPAVGADLMTMDDLRETWAQTSPSAHRRWRVALIERLGPLPRLGARAREALGDGQVGLADADTSMRLTAAALLRAWNSWLRGFSAASIPFLLERFVRRPGWILVTGDDVLVRLERRPLDVVLTVAGYTDQLDLAPLGGQGRVRFEVTEP